MISQTTESKIEILDKNMGDLLGYIPCQTLGFSFASNEKLKGMFYQNSTKASETFMLYNDKLSLTDSKLPYKHLGAFDFSTPCPLWMATHA